MIDVKQILWLIKNQLAKAKECAAYGVHSKNVDAPHTMPAQQSVTGDFPE